MESIIKIATRDGHNSDEHTLCVDGPESVLHIYCFIEEGEAAWYTKFCSCQTDNVFTTINRPPANTESIQKKKTKCIYERHAPN